MSSVSPQRSGSAAAPDLLCTKAHIWEALGGQRMGHLLSVTCKAPQHDSWPSERLEGEGPQCSTEALLGVFHSLYSGALFPAMWLGCLASVQHIDECPGEPKELAVSTPKQTLTCPAPSPHAAEARSRETPQSVGSEQWPESWYSRLGQGLPHQHLDAVWSPSCSASDLAPC